MPTLYTVRILRPCVCNLAPRAVGDIVEQVSADDKIGLVYHNKAEVIEQIDSAIIAADKREKARALIAEPAAESAPKKQAKKAAKKATKKAAE